MRKKTVLGIFRFASMVFLNIWKGYEQKNFPRYFQICKCVFFNIWKEYEQKIVSGIFRFASMLFLKYL